MTKKDTGLRRASVVEDIKEYGKPITPSELAAIISVSPNTVRKYHKRWGGIEVAPGKIRFFSNVVKEILNANAVQAIKEAQVVGRGDGEWGETAAAVQRRLAQEQTGGQ